MEALLQKHPEIRTAIIGGQGRPFTFAIVELREQSSLADKEKSAVLAEIWPAFEAANKTCSEESKLRKELILFASPGKPLPLTAKDTVLRPAAIALYQDEISSMYNNFDQAVESTRSPGKL